MSRYVADDAHHGAMGKILLGLTSAIGTKHQTIPLSVARQEKELRFPVTSPDAGDWSRKSCSRLSD